MLAIGTKMPGWVQEGSGEYLKRLPRDCMLEFRELPLTNRGKNTNTAQAIEKESQQLLDAIDDRAWVIALDSRGKQWSTEQLSGQMENWRMDGKSVVLLIGGPDGLSQACLTRANQVWSLSALTLPHPLVRVLLAEQIYRAWTILNNHPYHK
ncbi:23S rRNA (pseudouridine(1915)-N(3))-methyltransferase RlmH [Aurantivibrio plasticivorans]